MACGNRFIFIMDKKTQIGIEFFPSNLEAQICLPSVRLLVLGFQVPLLKNV